MEFEDRELTCVDCKQTFTFTAGEQQFFSEKGLSDPKRCKPCRQAKKERNQADNGPKRTRNCNR